jgi:phytoene synthase
VSPGSEHDALACRALIRQGSKSFHAASLLLPSDVRSKACALYAFCRLSDDAVDGPDARRDAVARLTQRLMLIYAGTPEAIPADRAFSAVARATQLPQALPEALLQGLAWDAEGRRFATLADLDDYAARVAGAVGAMMTVLMGVRDPYVLARACDLGVAMQYTNMARDVGEDARVGRLYLPLEWLAAEGVDPAAFLAAPAPDPAIRRLTRRLIERAEALYTRAVAGIPGLPAACWPSIHAARLVYREIGRVIAAHGYDSVTRRAVVPGRRKLELAMVALGSTLGGITPGGPALATQLHAPPLNATRYLVDAVTPFPVRPAPVPKTADERVGWIIDLFADMDRRREEAWSRIPLNTGIRDT